MISDWQTRNYTRLVFRGLRRRFKRAQYGRELIFVLSAMWDATKLPLALLVIGLFLSGSAAMASSVCTAIDPGACRPHADPSPFEGGKKRRIQIQPIAEQQFTATAVLADSCTFCGKPAGWK